MKRRLFLAAALSLALAPASALAGEFEAYKPGLIKQALEKGQTVFVDYAATWCSTCARQERVIKALREANPKYNTAMKFVKVDWDTYSGHEVTKSRSIPRRSTLIVLRGDKELGRIVAGTSEEKIKSLMDKAL